MMRQAALILSLPLLVLAACNRNSEPGNDREVQIDAAPVPAPKMRAVEALDGIATEAITVETMSDTDIASLGGLDGKCALRLTRVGFPSFVHDGRDQAGAIKLNGKLIPLTAQRLGLFADGDLSVAIRPVTAEFGADGVREAEMIVMLPGAKDELGYRGYEMCPARGD